jgi:molybdenum cofactor guanylyltransferase
MQSIGNPQSAIANRMSAVLLAGGRSTRMGEDKATLMLEDEPLWKRQMHKLEAIGASHILISTGERDGTDFLESGMEIVPDKQPDRGPLGGIEAAMSRTDVPWLLVLAVDVPWMSTEYLRTLATDAITSGLGLVPAGLRGFEPLVAVYPTASLDLLRDCLASGQLATRSFVRKAMEQGLVEIRKIAPREESLFRNVNTPEDFAAGLAP